MATETYAFSTDIQQLMSLIINTFYSNKEVFLRELISNASDALDKIRHLSIQKPEMLKGAERLYIRVIPDKANRTLTIEDTGIGMTKQDLANCLGTIARSGTKAFMEAVQAGGDVSMIGQFGVGFYSAYLVAEKVTVFSRHPDEPKTHMWQSAAGGSFTITEVEDGADPLVRGTRVVLSLKEDQVDYLEERRIKELVKKYSSFISFPIELSVERTVEKEVTVSEDEEEEEAVEEEEESEEKKTDGDEEGTPKVADVDEEQAAKKAAKKKRAASSDEPKIQDDSGETKKTTKKITEQKQEIESLNKEPLWRSKISDITNEAYASFYKDFSNDWESPLTQIHFQVQGQLEYTALLFIPRRAPLDMFQSSRKKNQIKLYVRRVFVTDDCDNLLPEWMSFVKGIIDAEDMPLNISRETLQQSTVMKVLGKSLTKKVLDRLAEMANDTKVRESKEGEEGSDSVDKKAEMTGQEMYEKFYEQYAKNIKFGIHDDPTHRNKLVELLRFPSSKSGKSKISFAEYVDRMKEKQTVAYFLAGDSMHNIQTSPLVERLLKRGFEVLYMPDPIDEYLMQQVQDYKGTKFVNCARENIVIEDETDEEKKQHEENEAAFSQLCKRIKDVLNDKVERVVISRRLVTTPCVMVANSYGPTANMERITRAQALASNSTVSFMPGKKIMELNADSSVVKELKKRVEEDKDSKDTVIKEMVWMLYELALLTSDYSLDERMIFANRIYRMIGYGLNIEETADSEMAQLQAEMDQTKVVEDAEAGDEDLTSKMEELD